MSTLPLNISKKVPKICSKEKKNQSALEILRGEQLKQFWKSRWKRGVCTFFWNNSILLLIDLELSKIAWYGPLRSRKNSPKKKKQVYCKTFMVAHYYHRKTNWKCLFYLRKLKTYFKKDQNK